MDQEGDLLAALPERRTAIRWLSRMIDTNDAPSVDALEPALARVFELAGSQVRSLDESYDDSAGSPVYTEGGRLSLIHI